MKKVLLALLSLLFGLLSLQCFAQYTYELDKTTRFEKMGVEEGLSSGLVFCVHQDKYGFIWIGNPICTIPYPMHQSIAHPYLFGTEMN